MSEDVNIEEKCWMCYDDDAVDILTKNMLLMFSFGFKLDCRVFGRMDDTTGAVWRLFFLVT